MQEATQLKKVTIRLRESDVEYLKRTYPHAGINKTLRGIVAKAVKAIKEKESRILES